MSDNEIMSLPDWDIAFDLSIDQFKKQHGKEPTLVELQNLIEILVKTLPCNGIPDRAGGKTKNGVTIF